MPGSNGGLSRRGDRRQRRRLSEQFTCGRKPKGYERPQQKKQKTMISINSPKITGYLKPFFRWNEGLRAIMRKYNLAYGDRDVINNRPLHAERVEKRGRKHSPRVSRQSQMPVWYGVFTTLQRHWTLRMLAALCTHQRLRHLAFGRSCLHARIAKSPNVGTHQH